MGIDEHTLKVIIILLVLVLAAIMPLTVIAIAFSVIAYLIFELLKEDDDEVF